VGELLSGGTFDRDSRKTVATVVFNKCKIYKQRIIKKDVYLVLFVFDI